MSMSLLLNSSGASERAAVLNRPRWTRSELRQDLLLLPVGFRLPQRGWVIIFRANPPRAQFYIAETLQSEGWFDEDGWYIRTWLEGKLFKGKDAGDKIKLMDIAELVSLSMQRDGKSVGNGRLAGSEGTNNDGPTTSTE